MPALHVFIDTNIFLNFYHFSDDSLEVLEELIELASPGEMTIHLPKQVENELKRNRESKLQFAMTDFKNAKLAAGVPHHLRGTESARQYDEAIKTAEKAKKVLIIESLNDLKDIQNKNIPIFIEVYTKEKDFKVIKKLNFSKP